LLEKTAGAKEDKNMLTLFYSPHMTSIDNEAGRASGHADVPLSEAGRRLAQEPGQHYAKEHLDAIFCSDLQRAFVTSQIAFAGRNVPIVPDARLREYDYGAMRWTPTNLGSVFQH
jgi:broad specificity phosphatase PhoE